MEVVVPWAELQALVEPHYPKAGKGRRPVGLAIMLRTYFMRQWFNLSDPGVDSKQGTVHSVAAAAANVADCRMLPNLLHGDKRKVWGDGGYQGQGEAIRAVAPHAQDMTSKRTRY